MTSDDARAAGRDLTARIPATGGGMYITFLCPCCGRKRDTAGRRMQVFRGIRTWVCRECKR